MTDCWYWLTDDYEVDKKKKTTIFCGERDNDLKIVPTVAYRLRIRSKRANCKSEKGKQHCKSSVWHYEPFILFRRHICHIILAEIILYASRDPTYPVSPGCPCCHLGLITQPLKTFSLQIACFLFCSRFLFNPNELSRRFLATALTARQWNSRGWRSFVVLTLSMLMRGCVSAATNIIESSRPVPTLAPSFPTHPRFKPPTPFIHLATSSSKTKCSGSEIGLWLPFSIVETPPSSGEMLKRLAFSLALYGSFVFLTVAGPVDSFLRGFLVWVGGWRTREPQGASIIWQHVSNCLFLPSAAFHTADYLNSMAPDEKKPRAIVW